MLNPLNVAGVGDDIKAQLTEQGRLHIADMLSPHIYNTIEQAKTVRECLMC